MKIYQLFGLIICISGVWVSCNNTSSDAQTSSPQIIEQISEDNTEFYAIGIDGRYMVEVVADDNKSYVIDGRPTDLANVIATVDKGRLTIRTAPNKSLEGEVTVKISANGLEGIRLNGDGRVKAENGTLHSETCTFMLAGSGEMDLAMSNIERVKCVISGSGEILLSGDCKELDVLLSGSGNLVAEDLEANEAKIKLIGSGECQIQVKDQLNATVTGSGNVHYKGDPQVEERISGSGKVIRMNNL